MLLSQISFIIQKEVKSLSLCKAYPPLFSGLVSVFLCGADPCDVSGLMIMDLWFLVLCALESVIRWRLSAIKVLLKLELDKQCEGGQD